MRVTKPHKRHAFPWPVRHRTEPPDQTPRPVPLSGLRPKSLQAAELSPGPRGGGGSLRPPSLSSPVTSRFF